MIRSLLFLLAELNSEQTGNVLIGSLILIVVLLVLFGGIVLYRRWMNADDTAISEGFTLSDLRKLHKAGQMTDEEFEKAKSILIGSLKLAAEKSANRAKEGPRTIPPPLDIDPPEK